MTASHLTALAPPPPPEAAGDSISSEAKWPKRRATVVARAGVETDAQYGAVIPPLHLSSNFTFDGFDGKRTYDYTRSGNPTRDLLTQALCELEGASGGVVTSSGMAAATLVCHLLQPGDLLVAPFDCYGGCHRLFSTLSAKGLFDVEFVDLTCPADPRDVIARLDRAPAMVWVETPSNPLLRITDLRRVAQTCRALGALLVCDNTFLSPALQRPLEYGADLVLHSTTKYLNGHSDVVGGAVLPRSAELARQLDELANCLGLTGAPFDSYLTLRGLRTLDTRWAAHERNALALVDVLRNHSGVSTVHHPSLPASPGHDVARQQQSGFGAIVSFELEATESVAPFVENLELFSLAESLGGTESLVAHPATMTHASMDAEARAAAGISSRLIRLSVGIEHTEDLVSDLECALERAHRVSRPQQAAHP